MILVLCAITPFEEFTEVEDVESGITRLWDDQSIVKDVRLYDAITA